MTKTIRSFCLAALLLCPLAAPAQTPRDAVRTRSELNQELRRYSSALTNILSLEPRLLTNQAYLAPYPELANFLNQHPEIAGNPSFYFPRPPEFPRPQDRTVTVRNDFGNLAAVLVLAMFLGLLIWLVRTVIDYRRWNQLAKIQTEVHTKILDRFTDNADLLAYIQSPAGKRFLESSPITLDAAPSAIGAPLGRILWSIQAGLILISTGIGIILVGGRFIDDAERPFQVIGGLAIAIGIGFLISSAASYLISRKLGLVARTATGD